ncbi:MAG: hypothetical protein WAW61_09990 [Methylococcaceae bacterium]
MEPLRIPTEEEVRTAAQQGEDMVVELVFGLVTNRVGILHQLEERIRVLEDQ